MNATEVAFHHGVTDKLGYACRLLRKVYRSGARAAVLGDAAELDQLNRRLWEFDAQEFIPHVRVKAEPAAPRLQGTPLWLVDDLRSAPGCSIVVNLGHEVPHLSADVQRLIEIVSLGETDRSSARARWKHYAGLGWPIQQHEVHA